MHDALKNRRPIQARNTSWAINAVKWLAAHGFTPNQISLLSLLFSLIAAFYLVGSAWWENGYRQIALISAAVFIVLRLLCNLFDGMLAIECGAAGKAGAIYNDLPDRPSDILILLGMGYATGMASGITMGWIAALLAVMTAYIRLLGHTAGTKQYFTGPMAKQQRMAVVIIACLLSLFTSKEIAAIGIFLPALVLINIGSLLTFSLRLKHIIGDLENGQLK